jgi:choline-sulfatase
MVTGRYVSDLGSFDNASEFSSEWPTMGHALGGAGYETTIVGKMHFVGHDQMHGFDRRIAMGHDYTTGYDPKDYLLAYDWEQTSGGNPAGPDWMGPSYVKSPDWDHYPRHYDGDEETHREALAYLSEKEPGSSPFFCCVSYHQPHNPFWIPAEIRDLFRDKDLPLPIIPPGVKTCHGPMDEWLNDFHYLPEVQERMMKEENLRWLYETYYGMVYDMDRRAGELISLLKERDLDKTTAVVFATDHGDMLAHRGMLQKRYFYERSVRTALIFSFPGNWKEGIRISTPVSLIDLLPTFGEMTDAMVPDDLPGRSLVPSVVEGAEPEERIVYSEYHGEGVHAPCFMALRGRYKYIYVHDHEERLYDVFDDPDEYVNLVGVPGHSETLSGLRKTLLEEFDPGVVAEKALASQRNRGFIHGCVQRRESPDTNMDR